VKSDMHLVLGVRVEVFLEADALAHAQGAHWAHRVVHGGLGASGHLRRRPKRTNSAQMWLSKEANTSRRHLGSSRERQVSGRTRSRDLPNLSESVT